MESESEEEEGHHDSAAALVEGSVHGGKPESGDGGERGQALVSLPGVTPVAAAPLLKRSLCHQREPLLRVLDIHPPETLSKLLQNLLLGSGHSSTSRDCLGCTHHRLRQLTFLSIHEILLMS